MDVEPILKWQQTTSSIKRPVHSGSQAYSTGHRFCVNGAMAQNCGQLSVLCGLWGVMATWSMGHGAPLCTGAFRKPARPAYRGISLI